MFLANRLRGAGNRKVKYFYRGTATQTVSTADATFSSFSIGSGIPTTGRRKIVVLINRRVGSEANDFLISSVTVGGVSATVYNSNAPTSDSGARVRGAIAIADASSLGSTANIVVTLSNAFANSQCRIFVYEVSGEYKNDGRSQVGGLSANPEVTNNRPTSAGNMIFCIGFAVADGTNTPYIGGSSSATVQENIFEYTSSQGRRVHSVAAVIENPTGPTNGVTFGIVTTSGRLSLGVVTLK